MKIKNHYRIILKPKEGNVITLTSTEELYGSLFNGAQLTDEIRLKTGGIFRFLKNYEYGLAYQEV